MDSKFFLYGWWKLAIFPALCQHWVLFLLNLSDSSFGSFSPLGWFPHMYVPYWIREWGPLHVSAFLFLFISFFSSTLPRGPQPTDTQLNFVKSEFAWLYPGKTVRLALLFIFQASLFIVTWCTVSWKPLFHKLSVCVCFGQIVFQVGGWSWILLGYVFI